MKKIDITIHKKIMESIALQKSTLEQDIIESISSFLEQMKKVNSPALVDGPNERKYLFFKESSFIPEQSLDETMILGVAFTKEGFMLIRQPDDEDIFYPDMNLGDDLLSLGDYVRIAEALNDFTVKNNI